MGATRFPRERRVTSDAGERAWSADDDALDAFVRFGQLRIQALEVVHALAQAGEVTQDRLDAAVFADRDMRAFTLFAKAI